MNEQLIIIIAILGMTIRLLAWCAWCEKKAARKAISSQKVAQAEIDFIVELRLIETENQSRQTISKE